MGRVETLHDPAVVEPLDAFTYGHTGLYETGFRLLAKDRDAFRYYNVLTTPLPQWVGGDDKWFNWADSAIVKKWKAVLVDTATGVPARFQYFGGPCFYDWSKIGAERAALIVEMQFRFANGAPSLFADQLWLTPREWMFDPQGPGVYDVLSEHGLQLWEQNILRYLELARARAGSLGGYVLANGDPNAPMPINIENAQWEWYWGPWQGVVALWRQNPKNILSVDPGRHEDSLLVAWMKYGGTISFTGDNFEQSQPFYLWAQECRKQGKFVPR